MQKHVQCLIGPIASGKSHYSRNAAQHGALIVNDDAIVMAVHGGDYNCYDTYYKGLYKTLENTILTVGLSMGRTVVVDRGVNNTVASRQRWIALARSLDVPCVAVTFERYPPDAHAYRRCQEDARGKSLAEWTHIAEYHESKFEHPTLSEGFAVICNAPYADIREGWWNETVAV